MTFWSLRRARKSELAYNASGLKLAFFFFYLCHHLLIWFFNVGAGKCRDIQMTARSYGRTIGYQYAIAWIWHCSRGLWTRNGRDRTREESDSHAWPKRISNERSERAIFKGVTGKWNFPRSNRNVSGTCPSLRGKSQCRADAKVYFSDAANDSHASLTIHRVLVQRALEMARGPEPEWFTFHGVQGLLRDNEGRPWFPYNPRYDSGLPSSSSSADSETGTQLIT